ncbi:uncharacterized protein A1O9_04140 [Exophiala aquamarina CBS 119918]|uniref:NmrA-like domain-containing protein n=1 Tax=Exophiala aquamarina CBS 119918 TaxID=1182545 RepID=A0A072PHJ0_9EURO|nr:uncharacterized protein A1O9_04140 [Exophiala aquamarina CBS 119918]KEF59296.1 hypothetical protein A1O9_04140 [Exophiala aquamarina CBS 119918]
MPCPSAIVLVTGATGIQGGGVVRELLIKAKSVNPPTPLTIRAFVRDPTSASAQSLVALDPETVQLFQGDFDDLEALTAASQGATATFVNVSPVFTDLEAESRHGHNILKTSLAAGVKHIIYSAVNRADNHEALKNIQPGSWIDSYYKSKGSIVSSLKAPPFPTPSNYTYTLLLPATFLSNYLPPHQLIMYPDLSAENPSVTTALDPALVASHLDPDDIGRFAASAILAPPSEFAEKWANKTIPLASINLTLQEAFEALTRSVSNRKVVTVNYLSTEEAQKQAPTNLWIASHLFLNDNPNIVDLEKVKTYGVPLGGVDEFFAKNRGRVEKALGL